MPMNLPAEAKAAYARYLAAKTIWEKIEALKDYYAKIPKHKGTAKERARIRKKIAELEKELMLQREKRRRVAHHLVQLFTVKKEFPQVLFLGFTNSGKSSLIRKLTNAKPEVSDTPLTTRYPVPASLPYKDYSIQLVEAPDFLGLPHARGPVMHLARNTDLIAIVVDLSIDPILQVEAILKELEKEGIYINKAPPPIRIKRTGSGGIIILGIHNYEGDPNELRELLREYGFQNAIVTITGKITVDDVIRALDRSAVYKKAVIIATKGDLPGSKENYEKLVEKYGKLFKIYPTCTRIADKERLTEFLAKSFDIIRVYTMDKTGKRSDKPILLKKGADISDLIKHLHRAFLEGFLYAKVYGPSAKYPGEKVGLRHKLKDGDVVQIVLK